MSTNSSTTRSQPVAWTVLLGPGARLAGLDALARAVSGRVHAGLSVSIEEVADLAELLAPRRAAGRLVLDGDLLPEEDLGFVRRFLAAHPRWSLLLVGADAGRRTARTVLSWARTGWLAWPPDLDQLEALVRAPQELLPRAAAPAEVRSEAPRAADPRLGEQLLELSELARGCERDMRELREAAGGEDDRLTRVSSRMGRLRREARALSYLTAPPRAGDTPVDLGALLEDELAELTLRDRTAARFLYRGDEGLEVRADREALTFALESLLLLARGACGPEDVVRVQLSAPEADGGPAEIGVDFPRGRLADVSLEHLDQPGALLDLVPELGASDLASTRAVLEAHGATLDLASGPDGAIEASLRLPARARPRAGASVAAGT